MASIAGTAVVCFWVAAYAVWRDERKLRNAAEGLKSAKRQQLEKLYVEIGGLSAQRPTNEEFGDYKNKINRWLDDTIRWIEKDLGVPAKERFLDRSGMLAGRYASSLNEEHNSIKMDLEKFRKNLQSMIETGRWL